MAKNEIIPEKRRLIEDLARDLIIEMENRNDVFDLTNDEYGEYFTGSFGDAAQSVIENFLISQIGKGLL